MHRELKIHWLSLLFVCLIASFCSWRALSDHQLLQGKWQQLKRQQRANSAGLTTVISDHHRLSQHRESIEALVANPDRYSHQRIALLDYLQRLVTETAPMNHAFSIAPAHAADVVGSALAQVAEVSISADFRHEDHLIDYLWHIGQQQVALLQIAAVDIDLVQAQVEPGTTANLRAKIRLHWYSLGVDGALEWAR